jgi:uncharacterized protein
MKTPFHIMLIPTLGCPARCSYCWSSERGSPVMGLDTVRDVVAWLQDFRKDPVTITFHGGEPLRAGAAWYREALPLIAGGLKELRPSFAMQSNLWLLTPELAAILAEYRIPIGTSIDGPKGLNDRQRGKGYFDRTMEGYAVARAAGLVVRFICTFTAESVQKKEEIFRFFLENGFVMKLHPALPSLRDEHPQEWALSPEEYGDLLLFLLDRYLKNLGRIEIMNINDLVKCVFTRRGTVCTYADCMGSTFAIGPDGSIYPCYRFIGMPEWVMGNVRDRPSAEDLSQSEAWRRMFRYKDYVDTACRDCTHIRYCRGGCPYNAIVANGGEEHGVDPHCRAYKRVFDEIADRFNREMFEAPGFEMTGSGPRARKSGIMALMRTIISG